MENGYEQWLFPVAIYIIKPAFIGSNVRYLQVRLLLRVLEGTGVEASAGISLQ
jgi:hypothetical protein